MDRDGLHDPLAPCVVWFRQDLRLADNPALAAAAATGRPVIGLYVLEDKAVDPWAPGAAARWWLHQSLEALSRDLARVGVPLILRRGDAGVIAREIVAESGARAIYWNRCYEPRAVARDAALKSGLARDGIVAESFNAALLFEPWEVRTKSGEPFKVFTPFWRAARARMRSLETAKAPRGLAPPRSPPASLSLDDLGLEPRTPDWAGGLRAAWRPGEAGAAQRLAYFLDEELTGYPERRNRPGVAATSRLSPHLHFGEIGPRQVWRAIEVAAETRPELRGDCEKFLAELGWREFSAHLLFHFPALPTANWRARFDAFPWRDDPAAETAWRRGRTGYPIVDAGMRELWTTGWMHNRVRMVAASFLIKHLMIDWRRGADWFWDTLVDADLANNAAGWQWVAGSGADAAPYFRIFNPVAQGETYDPRGDYVRRWIPEIARLPDAVIHKPWTAAPDVLAQAGLELGRDYPRPIVDHGAARTAALAAYKAIADQDGGTEHA